MTPFLLALLAAALPTPKLLVVDLDDLGREFLRDHPQPVFDALDQAGRRYSRFYTAPVCSPTRAQMLYGVRGSHPDLRCTWLVREHVAPYAIPTDGPLVPLPRALSNAGLTSAKVGKWHLGLESDFAHPLDCGWTAYVGAMGNVDDYSSFVLNVQGVPLQLDGVYLTALETELGIAAMRQGFDLVSVSYHAIHDPFHEPPAPYYVGPPTQTVEEQGAAMLQVLGNELTRLGQAAQRLGYHVLVFSDNGGKVDLGGQKGSLLDKGVRTPMWAFGPGVVPGTDDSIVAVKDVYATVLEFLGVVPVPLAGPESRSFLGTWWGQPGGREVAFQERYEKNGEDPAEQPHLWQRSIVGEGYKLLELVGQEQFFRYTETDEVFVAPGQLTPAEFDLRAEFRRRLNAWTGVDGPGY